MFCCSRCKKWVHAMKRENVIPEEIHKHLVSMGHPLSSQTISTKYLYLCEAHFSARNFMNPKEKGQSMKNMYLLACLLQYFQNHPFQYAQQIVSPCLSDIQYV